MLQCELNPLCGNVMQSVDGQYIFFFVYLFQISTVLSDMLLEVKRKGLKDCCYC
jgi:hypothetical protein